jgi:hypothetical protein
LAASRMLGNLPRSAPVTVGGDVPQIVDRQGIRRTGA